MFKNPKFDSLTKTAFGLMAAAILISCGDSAPTTTAISGESPVKPAPSSTFMVAGDHSVGNPDAEVTIIEYASVVCPACANWHNSVYPELNKKYIETGKVRYVFREFPTSPKSLAFAGFTIANCAGEDKFLKNISLQFKRQKAILSAPDKRKAYEDLAKNSGLSLEKYEPCLADQDWKDRYEAIEKGGQDMGVTSTPSFFINGTKYSVFTIEDFDKLIAPVVFKDQAKATTEKAMEAAE